VKPVVAALDGVAHQPAQVQGRETVRAGVRQGDRFTFFGPVEDEGLADDRAGKKLAANVSRPRRSIPKLFDERHALLPCRAGAQARKWHASRPAFHPVAHRF
jgi:hypothetical protein